MLENFDQFSFAQLVERMSGLIDLQTQSATLQTGSRTLPTFASIAAQNIPADVFMVHTLGYYSVGDGGGASYLVREGDIVLPYGGDANLVSKRSMDGRLWALEEASPYVEQCGAKGIPQYPLPNPTNPFDSYPAIQTCIAWNEWRGGGTIQSNGSRIYYLSRKVIYDPTLTGHQGQGGSWDWRLKTFQTFESQPELLTNSSLDAGASGWLISQFNTAPLIWSGGALTVDQASTVAGAKYAEVGQKIIAPKGALVRITVEIAYIHTVQDTVSNTPFKTLTVLLGRNSNASGPTSIGNMPVFANKSFSNSDANYAEPWTVTYEVVLLEDNQADPYFRLSSNASFKVNSVSVKIVPDNACMLCQDTHVGPIGGHTKRGWHQMRIYGRSDQVDLVDAIVFDSKSPLSSRLYMYDIDIGTGVGRALVFQNGTYLISAYGSRFSGSVTGMDTLQGAFDAGENLSFFGCTFGSLRGPCVTNRGMSYRFYACSLDYSGSFYRQIRGSAKFESCWFEKAKTTVAGNYYMEVNQGTVYLKNCDFFTNAAPPGILDAPFKVDFGATVIAFDTNFANLDATSDAMHVGGGDFIVRRTDGGANTPDLATRNPYHNVIPDGSFDGTAIGPNVYVDCSIGKSGGAFEQVDRFKANWRFSAAYTADTAIGSDMLLNTSTLPSTIQVGDVLTAPGVLPRDTVVLGINNQSSSQTVVVAGVSVVLPPHSQMLSAKAMASSTTTAIRYARPAIIGSAGIELSSAVSRSGGQSLRFFKTGGIGAGNPAQMMLLIPLTDLCRPAWELYYRVTPQPTATAGSRSTFFCTAYAVAGRDMGSSERIPTITKDMYFNVDLTQTIDRQTGRKVVNEVIQTDEWNRLSFSALRNTTTLSGHPSFTPVWATHLQVRFNMVSVGGGSPGFECHFDDMLGNWL